MFTYVLRKLLYMPFILLGVIAITFTLFTISTPPESLATIQLGEKATPRSKYEWLKTKGFIAWTERGEEKLAKMDSGELPTRTTQLFNASLIEKLAAERDSLADLADDIKQLSDDTDEDRAQKAHYADKVFANGEKMDALIKAARTTYVIEKVGQPVVAMAAAVSGARHAVEEAEAALKTVQEEKNDDETAQKALTEAQENLRQVLSVAVDAEERHKKAVADAAALIQKVEDVPPDLGYTNVFKQFGSYLIDLTTFDFGDTRTGRQVSQVLREGMWPSLSLALPAFLLAELIALFFGLLAAMYRKSKLDNGIVLSSIILMSLNGIAIIIAGQKFLASDWNYFPISGYSGGFGAVRYLLLPALLYVVLSFGEHVRFNRIVMLDEVGQDYVRTARSKGLNENSVLFKHVLRNSLIPLITRWVVAIPTLYTGSLILESFFGIPGLGYLTVDAIANSDGNVIRAIVFIGAVSFMAANLLSDVLYAVADPRIRLG